MVLARRSAACGVGLPTAWPAAVERFAHAVHRYADRVEVIPDRALRRDLREVGVLLNSALDDVRRLPRHRPSRSEVPQAVRAMLRAGTLCAHATETAVSAATASRQRQPAEVALRLVELRELADTIRSLADDCLPPA